MNNVHDGINGVRYWISRYLANHLSKPDRRSNSRNKFQFRFQSIRRWPIPSHPISVQYFRGQPDKVFVRWKVNKGPKRSRHFAFIFSVKPTCQLSLAASPLHRSVLPTYKCQEKACSVWEGDAYCLGMTQVDSIKSFTRRPALNLPNCHLVDEEARWWPRSGVQSSASEEEQKQQQQRQQQQ